MIGISKQSRLCSVHVQFMFSFVFYESLIKLFVLIFYAFFWQIFARITVPLLALMTERCCCLGQKYMADSVFFLFFFTLMPYLSIPPCNEVGCNSGTDRSFRSLQFLDFHFQPPDKLSSRCLHHRYFSLMVR